MKKKVLLSIFALLCGTAAGAANGLFGGGGGLVVVPSLKGFSRYSVREAHATAILVILPVTAVSAIAYLIYGGVDFSLLVPCALGVSAGGFLGAKAMKKFPALLISFLFCAVTLYAGIRSLL